MEQEAELTGQRSLSIIQEMIETAKQEQKDDGKGWILWGWMLFFASMLTVLNMHFTWLKNTYFFWNIFGGLSLLVAFYNIIRSIFFKKTQTVKTYTKALYDKLNTGFFICLMFIIVAMNIGIKPSIGFPLIMNLYAFWILIYGAVLNFRPSIIGAFIAWLLAFTCLFIKKFEWLMFLHGIAVLCGYIIPGHIANREFKKLQGRSSNKFTGV